MEKHITYSHSGGFTRENEKFTWSKTRGPAPGDPAAAASFAPTPREVESLGRSESPVQLVCWICGGDPVQHCWLGHCKVLNSPMTPASRLTCTVQVECLWFLVGICLFCTCFGTWYLLFWRAYGVMAFGRGLL